MSLLQDTEFVSGTTVLTEAYMDGINDFCNGVKSVVGETFTATDFRTGLGAAESGVNSTITSLTGITGEFTLKAPVLLGYGVGSGGTVTQLTSKSTGVTINKPSGQITMNSAALAGGATIGFVVSNSMVSTSDLIVLTPNSFIDLYTYSCGVNAGSFTVYVKNVTAGSRSDVIVFNFAVIKGATA